MFICLCLILQLGRIKRSKVRNVTGLHRTLDNKHQKLKNFDYFVVILKGNPNSTLRHGALKSYGFPTSKAEERILIGPQLCFGVNNQSAVEFSYNQHLKTACNDIISI